RAAASEHVSWRNLMPRVLGGHEPGKAHHRLQPVMALGFRGGKGRPGNRGGGHDTRIAARCGKVSEVAERALDGDEGKTGGTADGEIAVYSAYEHWVTSGQGRATRWSNATSTLA